MKTTHANIMIDLKHEVASSECSELIDELRDLRGVSRAWVSPRSRRMVFVDYDCEAIDSRQILHIAAQHATEARIVGI